MQTLSRKPEDYVADYYDFCRDFNLDKDNEESIKTYINEFYRWHVMFQGIGSVQIESMELEDILKNRNKYKVEESKKLEESHLDDYVVDNEYTVTYINDEGKEKQINFKPRKNTNIAGVQKQLGEAYKDFFKLKDIKQVGAKKTEDKETIDKTEAINKVMKHIETTLNKGKDDLTIKSQDNGDINVYDRTTEQELLVITPQELRKILTEGRLVDPSVKENSEDIMSGKALSVHDKEIISFVEDKLEWELGKDWKNKSLIDIEEVTYDAVYEWGNDHDEEDIHAEPYYRQIRKLINRLEEGKEMEPRQITVAEKILLNAIKTVGDYELDEVVCETSPNGNVHVTTKDGKDICTIARSKFAINGDDTELIDELRLNGYWKQPDLDTLDEEVLIEREEPTITLDEADKKVNELQSLLQKELPEGDWLVVIEGLTARISDLDSKTTFKYTKKNGWGENQQIVENLVKQVFGDTAYLHYYDSDIHAKGKAIIGGINIVSGEKKEEEYDKEMAFAQWLPMSFTDYVDNHIADDYAEMGDNYRKVENFIEDYVLAYQDEYLDESDIEEFEYDLAKDYVRYKIENLGKLEETRVNRTLHKGDRFVNPNGAEIKIISVDNEHLIDGEPQVTYQIGKDYKCYRQSSVNATIDQNNYKLQESKKITEGKYIVSSYYDEKLHGLEDEISTDNFDEVIEFAHTKLSQGNMVEIENKETGKYKRINPDEYLQDFEGEFPVNHTDLEESKKIEEASALSAKDDNNVVIVNKNQYGYNTIAIIIDNKNKRYQLVSGQSLPTGKYKKASKKAIRQKADDLKAQGYEEIKGPNSLAESKEIKTEAENGKFECLDIADEIKSALGNTETADRIVTTNNGFYDLEKQGLSGYGVWLGYSHKGYASEKKMNSYIREIIPQVKEVMVKVLNEKGVKCNEGDIVVNDMIDTTDMIRLYFASSKVTEGKVTTPKGEFDYEEIKANEKKVKDAFKAFWNGEMTGAELEKLKNEMSKVMTWGEIENCQYDASREVEKKEEVVDLNQVKADWEKQEEAVHPNNFKMDFHGTATITQGNPDAARETLKNLILNMRSSNIIDITVAVGEAKNIVENKETLEEEELVEKVEEDSEGNVTITEYTITFEDLNEEYFSTKEEADARMEELKAEGKLDIVSQYFRKDWDWDNTTDEYVEGYVEVYFNKGDELNEGWFEVSDEIKQDSKEKGLYTEDLKD